MIIYIICKYYTQNLFYIIHNLDNYFINYPLIILKKKETLPKIIYIYLKMQRLQNNDYSNIEIIKINKQL